MRIIAGICLLASFLLQACSGTEKTDPALEAAQAYQQELKTFWEQDSTTPLHLEEKAAFKGIRFYPLNKDYQVAARFTPVDSGQVLAMPTSAQKTKYFKAYGRLTFTIKDTSLTLTVYQADPPHEQDPDGLFLPFTDKTSGHTSYGAGRYLDLSIKDIKNGVLHLDFNKAYNPYCAYSTHYNCPIAPAVNRLPVAIMAGVSYTQEQH